MAQGLVKQEELTAIADAIREKNGSTNTYTPAEMATAIQAIEGKPAQINVKVVNQKSSDVFIQYYDNEYNSWSWISDDSYTRQFDKGTTFKFDNPCLAQNVYFLSGGNARIFYTIKKADGGYIQYVVGFVATEDTSVEFKVN